MYKQYDSIKIEADVFYYRLQEQLSKNSSSNELQWSNTLNIFQEGFPNYSLQLHIVVKDDYYMGNTLTKGFVDGLDILSSDTLRQIIALAKNKNWQPKDCNMMVPNGGAWLTEMGYDMTPISIQSKRAIHEFLVNSEEEE